MHYKHYNQRPDSLAVVLLPRIVSHSLRVTVLCIYRSQLCFASWIDFVALSLLICTFVPDIWHISGWTAPPWAPPPRLWVCPAGNSELIVKFHVASSSRTILVGEAQLPGTNVSVYLRHTPLLSWAAYSEPSDLNYFAVCTSSLPVSLCQKDEVGSAWALWALSKYTLSAVPRLLIYLPQFLSAAFSLLWYNVLFPS